MPDLQYREVIRIDPDGTTVYERVAVIPAVNGTPERSRVLEMKRVDVRALIPDRGELLILPPNGRCIRSEGNATVVVVEDPPAIRTIRWNTTDSSRAAGYKKAREQLLASAAWRRFGCDRASFELRLRDQREFSLAFPYVVRCYAFMNGAFQDGTVWFRTAPFTTERADLLVSNMPNQRAGDHHICSTEFGRKNIRTGAIISDIIALDQEFWGGVWNDHWMTDLDEAASRIPEVASPWDWELATREDPLFVLRAAWRPAETTIAEEVRRLLCTTPEAGRATFPELRRRIQVADVWDGTPPETKSAYRVSPAQYLVLADGSCIRVGDVVTFAESTARSLGIPANERHTIEWFGCADRIEGRVVKFADRKEPITLIVGGELVTGTTIVGTEAPTTPIILDGITVERGVCLLTKSGTEWPEALRGFQKITGARRDARGIVLVTVGAAGAFPIAIGEGDTLHEGLVLFPKEEIGPGGFLIAQSIVLGDGTRVSCGDRLLTGSAWQAECVIRAFYPMRDGGQRDCRCSDGGDIVLSDENGMHLDDDVLIYTEQPTNELRIGGRTIRLGDQVANPSSGCEQFHVVRSCLTVSTRGMALVRVDGHDEWRCIGKDGVLRNGVKVRSKTVVTRDGVNAGGAWYPNGGWYFDCAEQRLRKAVRYRARDESSADVKFADGIAPFIVDGDRDVRFTPALVRYQTPDGIHIRRGARLRLRVPVGEVPVGTEFRVSHITRDEANGAAMFVFEDGRGCPVTPANLACFEMNIRGQWVAFPGTPPPEAAVPGEGLGVGVRVRYIGGDPGTHFRKYNGSEQMAMATPAILVWFDGQRWACEFEQSFASLHRCNGRCADVRGQWIYSKYITRWFDEGTRPLGFTRVFTPRKSSRGDTIVPNVRLVNPGALVGCDHYGHEVRIGDRVRAVGELGTMTSRARELVDQGHIFTVVHYGRSGDGVVWCYLDAGEDVKQGVRLDSVVGHSEIPTELKDDATWWARLAWARVTSCEPVP